MNYLKKEQNTQILKFLKKVNYMGDPPQNINPAPKILKQMFVSGTYS